MHDVTTLDCSRIAQDFQIRKVQVESVVALLDEGNTVPFITRYRKERTGGLNEEVIRQIQARIRLLRQLADRKQTILKSIEGQGKLTAELRAAILAAETTKRLEDLYLPFKPKKRSQATAARERGLWPLALAVWYRDAALANLDEILPTFVNPDKGLGTPADVRTGVQHILAELIAETAEVRAPIRALLWETGKICAAKNEKLPEGQGLEHKDYFQFSEPLRQIPPHRILALNRGEKEGSLKIHLEWPMDVVMKTSLRAVADFAGWSQQAAGADRQAAGQDSGIRGQELGVKDQESGVKSQEAAAVEVSSAPAGGPVESNKPAADDMPSETALPVAEIKATETAGEIPSAQTESAPLAAVSEPAAAAPPPPPPKLPDPCPLPADVGEQLSPNSPFRTPHATFLKTVVEDALTRLLLPSLEREIRHELTDEAEGHAVAVFARNLRSLLLQPPLRSRRVLAIDPGFRTGCKVAVLDETGNLLEDAVVYPHAKKPPRERGSKPEKGPDQAPDKAAPPTPSAGTESTGSPAETVNSPTAVEPSSPPPVENPVPVSEAPAPPPESLAAPPPVLEGTAPPPGPAESVVAVAQSEAKSAEPPAPAAPPAPSKRDEALAKVKELVAKHAVQVVAIGNGTGCRETEELVAELIAKHLSELAYVIVNEAGASVYSVSPVGREEFPTFDSTLRGTISIGRRLQDPLNELVKVDPQSIGVGLYQHDVKRRDLRDSLDGVVESCVNQVGVDLNTASVPLLRYVSGLNQMVARELVDYRKQNGPFKSRDQLQHISGVGPARYVQAAGFLKIHQGDNPLDSTWIHPESYAITGQILADLGYGPDIVQDKSRTEEFQAKLKTLSPADLANRLGAGLPTVEDILQALARPGRDPREDLPPPIFKKGILQLEDLQPGMELKGTVLNVVDFGAFVDIGLKDSGLVHISQMANKYIKSPYDVVAVNDVVTAWVLTVDKDRHRVSLTMIKPGTERKPGEKRPAPARPQGRPPRGRRQGPAPAGQGQESGPPPGRGRGPRRGPPPPRPVTPAREPVSGAAPPAGEAVAASPPSAPPPRPAPPPPRPAAHTHHRKHRREAPRPKLSQDALEGKVPLRTFGELSALFAAKKKELETPPQPTAAPQSTAEAISQETPPAEQPAVSESVPPPA
jgi:uncharacterized protein